MVRRAEPGAGRGDDESAKASGSEQSDPIHPESHTQSPEPLVVPEPSHVPWLEQAAQAAQLMP